MERNRVSVERAVAWVDAATRRLEAEDTALAEAFGRVLGEDVRAARAIPGRALAARDGFALRAEDSVGAGVYNPLSLALIAVAAGEPLPVGTDAVVPVEQVAGGAGSIVLVEAVAPGGNVDPAGATAGAGAVLAVAGTRLLAHHIGLLAAAGFFCIPIVRKPRVRLAIAGSVPADSDGDADGPMLRAAIARDGGVVTGSTLADAFTGDGADLILVAGGSGPGAADKSAAALAEAGELAIHGVALQPGETAGFGRNAAGVPVLLLPGSPPACLWNYELFAGRAIRRLAGLDPGLPYRPHRVTAARKIVAAIGATEICPVRRLADGTVEPLASFAEIGLMAAAAADGFVIVPEASEGYPQGAVVTVYWYDHR